MKTLINLCLLILILAYPSRAKTPGINLGVRSGVIVSRFYGDDVDKDGRRFILGPCIKGLFEIEIFSFLSVQPEFGYQMKGNRLEGNYQPTGEWFASTHKLHYLDGTIAIRLTPKGKREFEPVFSFGPAIVLLIKAEEVYESEDVTEESTTTDITDNMEISDFGVTVGAGLQINKNFLSLLFDVRYTVGRGRIFDHELNYPSPDIYNNSFDFILGLSFPIRQYKSDSGL